MNFPVSYNEMHHPSPAAREKKEHEERLGVEMRSLKQRRMFSCPFLSRGLIKLQLNIHTVPSGRDSLLPLAERND